MVPGITSVESARQISVC